MWHKLIQTFVDNPVNESSPYVSQVERQCIMLKLKIIVSMLAVAGMTIFILGDTYLTTGLSVACAAVALPMSIYLTFRWFMKLMDYLSDSLLWLSSIVLAVISGSMAISVLQDIGAMDAPLSATIDNTLKMGDVGQYVSIASSVSILLSLIAPSWSLPKHDED